MHRISFLYPSSLTFCCNLFFSPSHSLLLLCTLELNAVCTERTRTRFISQPFLPCIFCFPLLPVSFLLCDADRKRTELHWVGDLMWEECSPSLSHSLPLPTFSSLCLANESQVSDLLWSRLLVNVNQSWLQASPRQHIIQQQHHN